jgi:hypothetical protein
MTTVGFIGSGSLTVSDPSVSPVMGLQHMASSPVGVWVW